MALTLLTNSDLVPPCNCSGSTDPQFITCLLSRRNGCDCRKGTVHQDSPKDVLTLFPRGKSGSCGLSLAQTSTSLLSPKKTKEKIWSCHSPCSHKRHSRSWPRARFCDAKHKLMSRSLHQIRDLSDFLYITHAKSGQTQILRGS